MRLAGVGRCPRRPPELRKREAALEPRSALHEFLRSVGSDAKRCERRLPPRHVWLVELFVIALTEGSLS